MVTLSILMILNFLLGILNVAAFLESGEKPSLVIGLANFGAVLVSIVLIYAL